MKPRPTLVFEDAGARGGSDGRRKSTEGGRDELDLEEVACLLSPVRVTRARMMDESMSKDDLSLMTSPVLERGMWRSSSNEGSRRKAELDFVNRERRPAFGFKSHLLTTIAEQDAEEDGSCRSYSSDTHQPTCKDDDCPRTAANVDLTRTSPSLVARSNSATARASSEYTLAPLR